MNLMGYILPYTSYQSIQYRSRDSKYHNHFINTHAISPLKTISPDENSNNEGIQQNIKSTSYKNQEVEKMYRELTGKGLNFNKLV